MTYWLCITNEENWKVIREKNIWRVPERHKNTVMRVEPRDKFLIYVKQENINGDIKPSRIVGAYDVASEPFKDSTRIFKTPKGMGENEPFPWRVKIKLIRIFEKPIEFKPLIPKLKFIMNKKKWSGHIAFPIKRDSRGGF